ncbi:hypothetical protein LDENG_00194280 [Lucifuga dentata]|nr:hypothetical protein LDENG_00194280 [Lucifuga dentata]
MCRSKNNSYVLVDKERDWCQALQYCRKHHHDLVSIKNPKEKQEVIKEGKEKSFWIGLLHDQWEWNNNGCSTFREWNSKFQDEKSCTVLSQTTKNLLHEFDCQGQASALCSEGSVRIKVVNIKLTWEKALEYCEAKHTTLLWIEDCHDQTAVEQWLNHTSIDQPLWLGLTQSRVFGFWFWSSNRIVEYDNWKDDEAPELPMSHHCGVIDKTDNYKWSDRNCQLELPFLCEEDTHIRPLL